MKKNILFIAFGTLFIVFIFYLVFFFNYSNHDKFAVKRIAHAGGSIGRVAKTNSIEALDSSVLKGFSYIEIDLLFTSDNELVCMHDWDNSFLRLFGFKPESALSLKDFAQLVKEKAKYNICTLDSLALWLAKNPDIFIITDVKEAAKNIDALKIISEKIPTFKEKIIPQIYFPEQFNKAKEMGFDQIIWTLYKYKGSNEDVLTAIKNFDGPFAITMTKEMAKTDLPIELKKQKIPVYTHTVNSIDEKRDFFENYSVSEVYTDFLIPD